MYPANLSCFQSKRFKLVHEALLRDGDRAPRVTCAVGSDVGSTGHGQPVSNSDVANHITSSAIPPGASGTANPPPVGESESGKKEPYYVGFDPRRQGSLGHIIGGWRRRRRR